MVSHEDMMGIIATEACELRAVDEIAKPLQKDEPVMICDLRLVREPDGTLTWQD